LGKTSSSVSAAADPAKPIPLSSVVLLLVAYTKPSAPCAAGCTVILVSATVDQAPLGGARCPMLFYCRGENGLRCCGTGVQLWASHRMDWTCTGYMKELGFRDVCLSRLQVVLSASKAVDIILRIDAIIKAIQIYLYIYIYS
jgi:hypothetical protein